MARTWLTLCQDCALHMEKKRELWWDGMPSRQGKCELCGVASALLWRYEVRPKDGQAADQSVANHGRPCPSGRHCAVRLDTSQAGGPSWRDKIHKEAQARRQEAPKQAAEKPRRRPRPPKWDYELACRLYDQGKNLGEIAQAVGANKEAVGSYMRKRGRSFDGPRCRRGCVASWDTAKAIEMRRQGVSFDAIAQAVGAKKSTVYNYLLAHNVQPDHPQPTVSWDTGRAAELRRQGRTVKEIAHEVGASYYAVSVWLSRHCPKHRKHRKKNTAPDA